MNFNAVDTFIFIESHKLQSVPVCCQTVASLFCAAGVISIVFILWNPTENVNICCVMPCWLHWAISWQRHEHLSLGMILEHSSAAPYSGEQTQRVAVVMVLETEGKSNIWCWPCPLECYFCASDTTHGRSPIVQQEECRSLFTAVTVANTLPRWHKCIRVLWDYEYDRGNRTYWTVFLSFSLPYMVFYLMIRN